MLRGGLHEIRDPNEALLSMDFIEIPYDGSIRNMIYKGK